MRIRWLGVVGLAVLVAGGVARAQTSTDGERGRVIDRDTGKPVPFAKVVGKYTASAVWTGTACNRIEGTVADAEGWFYLPKDEKAGPIIKEAFSHGYTRAQSPRYAMNLRAGDSTKWVVNVTKWDPVSKSEKVVSQEPTIYPNYDAALRASRERTDIYIASFKGSKEERLMNLKLLAGAANCIGIPKTTAGPIEYLDAIYAEQVEFGAPQEMLQDTLEMRASFVNPRQPRKPQTN